MYIKKSKTKSGRSYWCIAEGYYDPETKKIRTVNVKKLGYLDELEKEHSDPEHYYQAVVAKMNEEKKKALESQSPTVTLDKSSRVRTGVRKNFGYTALSSLYHELEIDKFFANRQRSLNVKYSLNAIMRLLLFSRLLSPGSEKKAFDERTWYFERSDMTLDDIYRSLAIINKYREDLQLWIHERITANYGRDITTTYYNITNYYFETDKQDEQREKGKGKERRSDPIIQMGLFTDNSWLPAAYHLFSGNNNDCTTLLPVIKRVRRDFRTEKLIVVSDEGMNTQKNAYYLAGSRGGYVFRQSIREGTKELKAFALREKDYEWLNPDFKKKSRQLLRDIEFEDDDGRIVKAKIPEKQVAFYSRADDMRAKAGRTASKMEDERYDGYSVVVTSRYEAPDDWVIDTYKGLWDNERTFKTTGSDLVARPVSVSREDHIQAYFLTCFVSLVIIKLLQKKVGNKYLPEEILNSLSKSCCSNFFANMYLFDYDDEILQDIGKVLGIDFGLKFRSLEEIKKIIAETRKH